MNASPLGSWEEAVEWLLSQPSQQELVKACYFDRPIRVAAERFRNSEEWQAVRAWLPERPGTVLDVGAGNGIASYALALDGWETTALEPESSRWVGAGAIRELAAEAGLKINVVQGLGESLPFADATFDAIHARQLLHHARELGWLCQELCRVLKPQGTFLATREHVISSAGQLAAFYRKHPLHRLYGGENAFKLREYLGALRSAGFVVVEVMGPFDSCINYAPFAKKTLHSELGRRLGRFPGGKAIAGLALGGRCFDFTLHLLSRLDRRPGRLYSFVARKMGD
jgi:SAM-dependent methyltransferase